MNNFGIYKLFSQLTAKNESKNAENSTMKNADLLSSLLKNVDLNTLKNLLFTSAMPKTSGENEKIPPQKRSCDGINSFIKNHDDFVKNVMKNCGKSNVDF